MHRLREDFKEERTGCINRIRGLLAECGVVVAQSPRTLRDLLPDALEDADNEMNGLARLAIERAADHWRELEQHIAWSDERIAQHWRDNAAVKQAAQLIGIGPVTASAVISAVGDFKQFQNGSQFAAWLGVVPRQRSSGGKSVLGGITNMASWRNIFRPEGGNPRLVPCGAAGGMTLRRCAPRFHRNILDTYTAPPPGGFPGAVCIHV